MKNTKKGIILIVLGVIIFMICWQVESDVKIVGIYTVSSGNGYEENITFIANKVWITKPEELAQGLIERCIDNNFQEVLFSYDLRGYPNEINLTVYANDITYKCGMKAFEAIYKQREGEIYEYNIKDNPEKFCLTVTEE